MRTIKEQDIPQVGNDLKFPNGQVRNETDTVAGTPVINEVYGDIIENIYKIVRSSGISFTETEDSEDTQHQLLQALKVFTNDINDKKQLLSVNGLNVGIQVKLNNLPQDYVFITQVSEDILAGENYNLASSVAGSTVSFNLTATNDVKASNYAVLVLNSNGAVLIPLGSRASEEKFINASFGTPISYNSSSEIIYISEGNIIKEFPSNFFVENKIQVSEGNNDLKLLDAIAFKGKLICLMLDTVTLTYRAFSFSLLDLDTIEQEITLPALSGVDNQPYMYCDGNLIYFTNSGAQINDSVNDNDLGGFSFNENTFEITATSSVALNSSFTKTTNVFVTNAGLYTFIGGELFRYALTGANRSFIGNFNIVNGVVFSFKGINYFSDGSVATKWNY